jgi:hypothetical protein
MIGIDGQVLTLKDHLFPTEKLIISSEKCNKLIAKGASGTGYAMCKLTMPLLKQYSHQCLNQSVLYYTNSRISSSLQWVYLLQDSVITKSHCSLMLNHLTSGLTGCHTARKML